MKKEKKEQQDNELNTIPKVTSDAYDDSDAIEVLKDSTKHPKNDKKEQ